VKKPDEPKEMRYGYGYGYLPVPLMGKGAAGSGPPPTGTKIQVDSVTNLIQVNNGNNAVQVAP